MKEKEKKTKKNKKNTQDKTDEGACVIVLHGINHTVCPWNQSSAYPSQPQNEANDVHCNSERDC